jgi:signal peptide peptidase SppA
MARVKKAQAPPSYDHVLGYVLDHPWALTDGMRQIIAGILARRVAGHDLSAAEIAAALPAPRVTTPAPAGTSIAVIPIAGVIAPRMNLLSDISGGATFEGLTADLRAALDDPTIGTIVLDVDSPGGNVAGATEFHAELMKARDRVTLIGQVNHLGASAAYWALSACHEIIASKSSLVGAIGVYTLYDDLSAALEELGIKREVIAAGKYKADGVDNGPLSPEARAHMKTIVNATYTHFVDDIAAGRGISPDTIRNGYGEGRILTAEMALAAGLVDRIGTLDDTLARAQTPHPSARSAPRLAATAQNRAPARVTAQEPSDQTWQIALQHDCYLLERHLS